MTARQVVLCIDDTFSVRLLVRRLLSRHYELLEASEGLEGLDMAVAQRPDLILVDLHMPHLNGFEVTTRLKALLPQVPVVALTADVTQHVRERALAAGCDGYLSKPIDPDTFPDKVAAFLDGKREYLQDNTFREAYQRTLVARMEEKVRELTKTLGENRRLNRQNQLLLKKAQRRARLLKAAARVGKDITSILDMGMLLNKTVDIICETYGFYYAGVFLLDESGEWAFLRAGYGEAGAQMVADGHRLAVGGASMIGSCLAQRKGRIVLDVGADPIRFKNPLLPETHSEMALPLLVGDKVIGALTVQSQEKIAFSEEDITSLQAMADQLAVAITNARLLEDLEKAHEQLVRTKTFEAIATATGEAIHWVGNKAAPIPGSVERIKEDLARYLVAAQLLATAQLPVDEKRKYERLFSQAVAQLKEGGLDLAGTQAWLGQSSWPRLRRILNVDSLWEDLEIIVGSAQAILNIKEDLIGPARQQRVQSFGIEELVRETVAGMGLPLESVEFEFAAELPFLRADRVQVKRVLINLFKNAMEAMAECERQCLRIDARLAEKPGFMAIEVTDSGAGIPPEVLDKIWVAFFTTKGESGGTGLGLPACAQIVGYWGGEITVTSAVGVGTTFTVTLPLVEAATRNQL
ncbi:MAG: response regulator [Anaerolineae bacterium]|nr:response regulator [Anaerolineae bacterium]